ncbi:MAG: xylose isomerase [Rhodothermales bacterium]|jgi:xylose isomerase
MSGEFRFSFGPWNISEGADCFGPAVRKSISFDRKLAVYQELGFGAVQLHDDDAVPNIGDLSASEIASEARGLKAKLDNAGLIAEFVAPRLWEDARTVDGGFTANCPKAREYALERLRKSIDVANELGTDRIVLWLAREGTYVRESKDPVWATQKVVEALQHGIDHDPNVRFLIEPKPNEPVDSAIIPTVGHALALGPLTSAPERVGALIESAHSILAGLDPSDDMGFALACGKLWGVHLNDQNGMKYDQDKAFGSANLRRALNQVQVLDRHGYGSNGEWVGLDVKALRTQPEHLATLHLANSKATFMRLLEISRSVDEAKCQALIADCDYESLDRLLLEHLMGA